MLGVSRKTLSEFVNGKASLSIKMAIRIANATGTSAKKLDEYAIKVNTIYHISE